MAILNRAILLIDINAFFAQVEQTHNPWLKGKPIFVAGGPYPRSVVTAASYEAKAYGVKSGMSLLEAKKLCPYALVVIGNQDKYLDYCYRLFNIYHEFTDLVEPYSIDEAFLDVTNVQRLFGPPVEIAQKIKARIQKELDLTCSIGIGPNKLLAKMAADMQKPNGLVVLQFDDVPKMLWHLPAEKLLGVGERIKLHLQKLGISTIGDLAHSDIRTLKQKFGRYGEVLYQSAWGRSDDLVNATDFLKVKSVGHSYTLPYDTTELETIKWYLYWLSSKIARRLQKEKLCGRTISFVVRTNDFSTFSKSETIPEPTDYPQIIGQTAYKLFIKNYLGLKVRLLGIRVSNLTNQDHYPLQLFYNKPKMANIFHSINEIKNRYGEETIDLAIIFRKHLKTFIRKKVGCFLTQREKGSKFVELLKIRER